MADPYEIHYSSPSSIIHDSPPSSVVPTRTPSDHVLGAASEQRSLRLECLKLALDSVIAGDSDPDGTATANKAIRVAALYMNFVEQGVGGTGEAVVSSREGSRTRAR